MFKKNIRFSILLACLSLVLLAAVNLKAQTNALTTVQTAKPEVEDLRREIEEQKAEIQKLRQDLKAESDQRKQQQQTLEALLQKFEKLDQALAKVTTPDAEKPVTVLNAAGEKLKSEETATAQVKAADTNVQTGATKQQDKTPTVEVGFGKIRISGLFQGWYNASNRTVPDSFRIRRAELRFTGDLMPKVRWSIMFDVAKVLTVNNTFANINNTPVLNGTGINQSSRIFQEAFVTLGYFKHANIQVGQYKLPVSLEGLQSSAALDTIERALFLTDRARGGGLGEVRDTGLMVFGPINKQFEYQFGVFNGAGESMSDVDRNEQKAVAGRFVFHPTAVKGLHLGASGIWGGTVSLLNPRRDRFGAEFLYDVKHFRFKSEYVVGVDSDIHRRGFYAHFGYRFRPKLEAIFRYDTFDPDIRRETNSLNVLERDYIGGLNYYIKENNLKLQLNYLRKTTREGIIPSRNQFVVNLQTAW